MYVISKAISPSEITLSQDWWLWKIVTNDYHFGLKTSIFPNDLCILPLQENI